MLRCRGIVASAGPEAEVEALAQPGRGRWFSGGVAGPEPRGISQRGHARSSRGWRRGDGWDGGRTAGGVDGCRIGGIGGGWLPAGVAGTRALAEEGCWGGESARPRSWEVERLVGGGFESGCGRGGRRRWSGGAVASGGGDGVVAATGDGLTAVVAGEVGWGMMCHRQERLRPNARASEGSTGAGRRAASVPGNRLSYRYTGKIAGKSRLPTPKRVEHGVQGGSWWPSGSRCSAGKAGMGICTGQGALQAHLERVRPRARRRSSA
jgi:hypothetical protein